MPVMDPTERNTAFEQTMALGPVAQTMPVLTGPTAIPAGGQWVSPVLPSDGFRAIVVGATSTQGGVIVITRYIDQAGTVLVPPSSQVALTAGAPNAAVVSDSVPFAAFTVTITNTGAAVATVSNFGVLMNGG